MEAAGKEQSEPNHAPSPEQKKCSTEKPNCRVGSAYFHQGLARCTLIPCSEKNESWDEWKCADTMTENVIANPR